MEWVPDRPFNDNDYAVDDAKLRALGWTQRTGFEEGLSNTVEWYRRCGSWWWGAPANAVASGIDAKVLPAGKASEGVLKLKMADVGMGAMKKQAMVMIREPAAAC